LRKYGFAALHLDDKEEETERIIDAFYKAGAAFFASDLSKN